jgi:large subunit ribosomal protein L30
MALVRKLKITQVKSAIGRIPKHRRTVAALGIKRIGNPVTHDDTPVVRGMINLISYLLSVLEIDVEVPEEEAQNPLSNRAKRKLLKEKKAKAALESEASQGTTNTENN